MNQLSGSLPTNMCFGLPKLELFYVDGNDLSGKIPSIWHHCKELVELQLGDNKFNGGSIPSDIVNLTNLQSLYLSYSNLQGKGFNYVVVLISIPVFHKILVNTNNFSGLLLNTT